MSRNGSGTYNLPATSWFPGVNGVTATTVDWNTTATDMQSAITQSVSSDGQTPMTGNLPLGNNKITGLANGVAITDAATVGQTNTAIQAFTGSVGPIVFRNKLINGNFAINQRVYGSGVATTVANQVTVDRWRVVTIGQSITFGAAAPDRVVTAPAGGLEQVIPAAVISTAGVYTLAWTGTATATVNGTPIISGGNTASLPVNTAVTIRFISGTVDRAQFEIGTVATTFERRDDLELLLCQRDYAKSYAQATAPGTAGALGSEQSYGNLAGSISMKIALPVVMRSAPTISLWSNNGVANQWVAFTGAGVATSYAATSANIADRNFSVSLTPASGEVFFSGQWVAATGF